METPTCSVEQCTRPVYNRGVCTAHYFRLRRNGEAGVKPIQRRLTTFEDRLSAYVQITGFCWLWTGYISKGYGLMSMGNRVQRPAHIVVYEHLVGPIPDGLELDHLCRVKRCVNPDHLEPVTHAVNCQRAVAIRRLATT